MSCYIYLVWRRLRKLRRGRAKLEEGGPFSLPSQAEPLTPTSLSQLSPASQNAGFLWLSRSSSSKLARGHALVIFDTIRTFVWTHAWFINLVVLSCDWS